MPLFSHSSWVLGRHAACLVIVAAVLVAPGCRPAARDRAAAACGLLGGLSGAVITLFQVPPFIVTLAMMLVASGLAYLAAAGQSIYQIPESFVWLGRGTGLFGLPHAVVLMLALYATAHVLMSRTTVGRYLYAVGGNAEAARLAGGEGRILGTLIGALIIAVIQNGMNLVGIESYTQKVVLGLVILAAVLIDRLRRG